MTQVTRRLATVLAFSALLTAPRSAYSSESGGWYPGFEDAQRSASDSGQPLLLHFHATYCGPCRRMNREVFGEPDVQQRLRNGIAAAEVDVSEHPEIAQRYGASTVPRDVVVFPDGSIETVNVGFMPRAAYMSMLASIADRGYTMAAARQRQLDLQRQSDQQITPESAQAIVATDSGDDAPNDTADVSRTEDDSVLGLEGFCPVRLHEDREWVKGSPEFTDTHHGVVYYFSGQKELQEFRYNKDKYAPQNLGCDTVVLSSEQQAVAGRIKYGAFFDGRLYLFSSFENRKEFKAHPLRYTHIRHAIKVDQLVGQRFQ